MAGYQFERFVKSYPKSDKITEATFFSAKSYYELSPRYSLDQADTDKALIKLQNFINANTESKFYEEANAMAKELTTKKERKGNIELKEQSIFLKQNNSQIQVELDSILYIEASGNYTKVVTTNDIISIREKISDTIQLLSNNDFIQVHKSFAVAKKNINRIEGNRIHIEDYIVPIGKLYKNNLNKIL